MGKLKYLSRTVSLFTGPHCQFLDTSQRMKLEYMYLGYPLFLAHWKCEQHNHIKLRIIFWKT